MPLATGSQPPFVPTEAEIREACRAIQATWSPEERVRRSRFYSGGFDLPGVRLIDTSEWRRAGYDVGD